VPSRTGRTDLKHSFEVLARPLQSLPGGAVEFVPMRSAIGPSSSTASSSIALSSAKDPGASPGAAMNVVGGMCSGTIFWLIARFWVRTTPARCRASRLDERPVRRVLHTESCRSAISVPVRSAPRVIFMYRRGAAGGGGEHLLPGQRGLTGRPSIWPTPPSRNAGTSTTLPPKAPPTKG